MAKPKVRTTLDGLRIRETPVDGKPVGQVYTKDVLKSLESPKDTAAKIGVEGQWLKIKTPDGIEAYVAAWYLEVIELDLADDSEASAAEPAKPESGSTGKVETPATEESDDLWVRPTMDGLRVRETPVDGKPVGQVSSNHALKVLENDLAAAAAKIGVEGQWIKIRTPDGIVAFTAAWFVEKTDTPAYARPKAAGEVNIMGMNLDNYHPLGTPDASRLAGLGWVRFGYNVSAGTGSTDIQKAYNTYAPLAEKYANAGMKILFATSHQTYGEGRNEYWPWQNMTDDKWRDLTAKFTDMMGRIAQQYAGSGLVHAWQIWNEQDAPTGAVASVPMSPANYAHLLSNAARAIRAVDDDVLVITGGHTRGPGEGAAYARATVKALPPDALPDGIAFHPYGRGTQPGTRYANWGHIQESLAAYTSILPDRPVWITEWGVLDKEGDNPGDVANYARSFIDYVNNNYPGKVATAMWYAWAMGMHNGYGLVGRDDKPLDPLNRVYRELRG